MIKVVLVRTSKEIYLFDLKTDGMLEVLSGDRYMDDFTDAQNINIIKTESKRLSDEEFMELSEVISKIQDFKPSKGVIRSAWDVIIKLDDRTYRFTYGNASDKNLDELITYLIELSPFDIVDIAGNPVQPVKLDLPK